MKWIKHFRITHTCFNVSTINLGTNSNFCRLKTCINTECVRSIKLSIHKSWCRQHWQCSRLHGRWLAVGVIDLIAMTKLWMRLCRAGQLLALAPGALGCYRHPISLITKMLVCWVVADTLAFLRTAWLYWECTLSKKCIHFCHVFPLHVCTVQIILLTMNLTRFEKY